MPANADSVRMILETSIILSGAENLGSFHFKNPHSLSASAKALIGAVQKGGVPGIEFISTSVVVQEWRLKCEKSKPRKLAKYLPPAWLLELIDKTLVDQARDVTESDVEAVLKSKLYGLKYTIWVRDPNDLHILLSAHLLKAFIVTRDNDFDDAVLGDCRGIIKISNLLRKFPVLRNSTLCCANLCCLGIKTCRNPTRKKTHQ